MSLKEEVSFQSFFFKEEKVSDVIWQVIPGVRAIDSETTESILFSFVAVFIMFEECEKVSRHVIIKKGREGQNQYPL